MSSRPLKATAANRPGRGVRRDPGRRPHLDSGEAAGAFLETHAQPLPLVEPWSGPEASPARKSLLAMAVHFILLGFIIVWSATLIVVFFALAEGEDRQFDSRLRNAADQVVSWLYAQTPNQLDPDAMVLFNLFTEQGFRVERSLSLVLGSSGRFLLNGHSSHNGLDLKACHTSDWEVWNYGADGQTMRALCRMVAPSAVAPSNLIVLLTTPVERHEKRILEIYSAAAGPLVIGAVLSLILVFAALRRSLAELRKLQAPLHMQGGVIDCQPLPMGGCPREVLPLAEAYSRLLREADTKHASERRFLGNAAHQLRTPLAGLTAQAELALASPDETSLREGMAIIRDRVDAIARLITQFLTLARLEEHDRLRAGFRSFDIGKVCEEVVLKYASAAKARRVDLGVEGAMELPPVYGDPLLIGEMLANLVDNAIKYTPPGGTVTLAAHLSAGDDEIELRVEDNGPGMSAKDIVGAFVPFSRPAGQTASGSGLGFSIVQEIAAIHGITLRIRAATPHGGTLVTAALPRLSRSEAARRADRGHAG